MKKKTVPTSVSRNHQKPQVAIKPSNTLNSDLNISWSNKSNFNNKKSLNPCKLSKVQSLILDVKLDQKRNSQERVLQTKHKYSQKKEIIRTIESSKSAHRTQTQNYVSVNQKQKAKGSFNQENRLTHRCQNQKIVSQTQVKNMLILEKNVSP